MKEIITIFVDDIRESPYRTSQVVARNYNEAIDWISILRMNGYGIILDLDHDLGERKSGYDICKFIVENQIPLEGYKIHSMNPVGVANMRQLLSHYEYKAL